MHQQAHKHMQVELTQTQTNAVERMHADVERRILLAPAALGRSTDFDSALRRRVRSVTFSLSFHTLVLSGIILKRAKYDVRPTTQYGSLSFCPMPTLDPHKAVRLYYYMPLCNLSRWFPFNWSICEYRPITSVVQTTSRVQFPITSSPFQRYCSCSLPSSQIKWSVLSMISSFSLSTDL